MKRNFDAKIKQISGEDLVVGTKKEGDKSIDTHITQRECIINALLATYPDEPDLAGTEKIKRGNLAERIYTGGDVDLNADELALIQTLISKHGVTLVVWQISKNLDTDA